MNVGIAAALTALVLSVLGGLFSLFPRPTRYDFYGLITVFVLLFGVNVLFFAFWRPIFNGGGWTFWAFVNLVATALLFWGFNSLESNFIENRKFRNYSLKVNAPSIVTWVFLIAAACLFGFGALKAGFLRDIGQDNATKLASIARVETPQDAQNRQQATNKLSGTDAQVGSTSSTGTTSQTKPDPKAYPETSQEHIPVVLISAARSKAEKKMGEGNLSSFYDLNDGEKQVVKGSLVYVFDMTPNYTWKQVFKSKAVTKFITVNAEDPDLPAELHDATINCYPGGKYDRNLERKIYWAFPDYYNDGLSPEVDDNGKLHFTSSLNQTPIRWGFDDMPVKALDVDAETCKMKSYDLPTATTSGNLPAWMDRVISAEKATKMISWQGEWGKGPQLAPYSATGESANNRTKPAGDANIVFTNEGPAYQFLTVAWNINTDDKPNAAAQEIILMDTRTGAIRIYSADGVQIESSLKALFRRVTAPGVAQGIPDDAAIYELRGRRLWIGGLIPEDKMGTDESVPFAGIGASDAVLGDTASAIIANSWGEVLNKLSSLPKSRNADKSAKADPDQIEAVVLDVQHLQDGSVSKVAFWVMDKKGEIDTHTYIGVATENERSTLVRLFVKRGDEIIIGYTDDGTEYRSIDSLSITKKAVPLTQPQLAPAA